MYTLPVPLAPDLITVNKLKNNHKYIVRIPFHGFKRKTEDYETIISG